MPVSPQFCNLRSRIRQLRDHFLPITFDPTGTYSDSQVDHVRAFRLLAHAELEWYLEEIAVETANKAFDAWQHRGLVTRVLVAMVSSYADGKFRTPLQLQAMREEGDLKGRIEKCKNAFNTYAKGKNHGIREENILRLLLPLGIDETDIDQTWLSTTSSFGQSRGHSAHQSMKVYNPPDPKNELGIVNQILEGLSDIDAKLAKFRSL